MIFKLNKCDWLLDNLYTFFYGACQQFFMTIGLANRNE